MAGPGCWPESGPEVQHYVVQRGDTLSLIARRYGVEVDDLRRWNGIEGDLIEVDQVLRIEVSAEPPAERAPTRPARPRSTAPAPAAAPALVMPDPKPCLAGPSLEGGADGPEMAASEGLSREEVSRAMDAFLPQVLPCLAEAGASPTGALLLEFEVGCDGRVRTIEEVERADWPPEVATCVVRTLRYAPFPAHALPDGDRFRFPLRYTPG